MRTRTDSTAGQRLDFSWDNDPVPESPATPPTEDELQQDTAPQDSTVVNDTAEAQVFSANPADNSVVQPQDETSSNEDSALETSAEPSSEDSEQQVVTETDIEPPPSEPPKKAKSRTSRGIQNTSIVSDGATLGNRLKECRENANVSIEDLSRRLFIQPSIIQDLENGDYASLSRSFKENNSIYLVSTLKDICSELGVSKNQTDDMVDLYYNEIAKSGLSFYDTKTTQIADKTENTDNDGGFTISSKEPIIKQLPKILVFLLLLSIVIFILFSVVLPFIRRSPVQQRNLDFAPLITPEKTPPIKLNVP